MSWSVASRAARCFTVNMRATMPRPADEPWEIFDDALPLLGARYSRQNVRMIALGLRGGGLVIVSPGKGTSEARFTELERWGKPRFLLAPNHFHNAGLAEWKSRYPEAEIVAHPNAQARLRKKVPGVEIGGVEALSAALPEGARVFGPPMAKQGELLLSTQTKDGRALFVCDAILNEREVPWPLWILGFRPRLMTNPFFKRIFLRSKAEYKTWLAAELDREPPAIFIPSHGGVLRGSDVASRLREVTESA